jgi:5-methylcytosine-specific restriction endonuclease McrA
MAGSFCTVCRRRTAKGSRCRLHPVRSPSNRAWHEPGATRTRLRVLKRDDFKCTRCGSASDLEVHHIVGSADGGATTMANCITLCHDCHVAAEAETKGES